MSHPDPHSPPDRTPIEVGEVFENPVTGERSTIVERPWDNPEGRLTSELTALVGARVAGEHYHPAIVERFTVLEGELTVMCAGQTSILGQGESTAIAPRFMLKQMAKMAKPKRVSGQPMRRVSTSS